MKQEIYALTYALEENYWWYAARREIIKSQVKKKLGALAAANPKLLDFGCGTGINLTHFKEFTDVAGIDASEDALDFCRQRGIKNLAQIKSDTLLQTQNPFKHEFELITMLDVLEHIPDEVSTLKHLGKWLTPQGLLLAVVPAYEILWSGEDYVSRHLRRYTKASLAKVFHAAGYEIVKATYFNFFLLPLQAAAILWQRLFSPRSMYKTTLHELPKTLNKALTEIMKLESSLINSFNLPFGGSILCFARYQNTNPCLKTHSSDEADNVSQPLSPPENSAAEPNPIEVQ